MSEATTGAPARTASITGRDSPSSKDDTTTRLADARSEPISSSLSRLAVMASPGLIAAAIDQWWTRSSWPAMPMTTTSRGPDSPAVAAPMAASAPKVFLRGSSPVITTMGPTDGDDADDGAGPPAGSTSSGHATAVRRAPSPVSGRFRYSPSCCSARFEMQTNSS